MGHSMTNFLDRVASAPISWGVCEVPGWGAMLPADRVLREMTDLGLTATEYGSPGFLPDSPGAVRDLLAKHEMSLIGGFTPLVLHERSLRREAIAEARRVAEFLSSAGATEFVSCPVMDADWSEPRPLEPSERANMFEMFSIIDEICGELGMHQVLHPHVQTVVETTDEVQRVLDGCDVNWCLDTGHFAIGGADPVAFAKESASRVGHVHLKDVNMALRPGLMRREMSIMDGVQQGLFPSLGQGDVDIAAVIVELEKAGYQGWYVIEQDTAITGSMPAPDTGPVTAVSESMSYLREIVAPLVDQHAKGARSAEGAASPSRSDGAR